LHRKAAGKPLPLDSKEMVAILSYLKWINSFVVKGNDFEGSKIWRSIFREGCEFSRGGALFAIHCQRCHGGDGEGKMKPDRQTYLYPPLWGLSAYQSGSSMHRVIKLAQWLKANMPYERQPPRNPFIGRDALDIAAFVNDDAFTSDPHR
jgi:thiosulfate dehydrogenase